MDGTVAVWGQYGWHSSCMGACVYRITEHYSNEPHLYHVLILQENRWLIINKSVTCG